MRNLKVAVLVLTAALATSVGSAEKNAVDPELLTSYITARCPSEAETGGPQTLSAGWVSSLIGLGIDYLVDQLGDALAEAAAADKDGRATKSVAPSYLYSVDEPAAEPSPGKIRLPGCAVIAIADSPPSEWCKHEPFASDAACTGAITISSLLVDPVGVPTKTGSSLPKFYAEIVFVRSVDSVAFMPKLISLYYPAGISKDKKFSGKKPRALSITVGASGAGGEPAITSLNIVLKGLVPLPGRITSRSAKREDDGTVTVLPDMTLDKAAAPLWHALAKLPARAVGGKGDPMFPVNITTEVREVADANVFLQVLAKVFAKQKDALKAEAKSSFVPSMAAADAQKEKETEMTNEAAYDTAVAQAFTVETSLRAACKKAPKVRSEVLAMISALSAAQQNVRKLEFTQSRTKATYFKPDTVSLTVDFSRTEDQLCHDLEI